MSKIYNGKDGWSVKWNESATFNIFLHGKEVDVATFYGSSQAGAAKPAEADKFAKSLLRNLETGRWQS